MKTIEDQIKTCHGGRGSQRLKAPGDKGYFCKFSCDNESVSCDDFDSSRTHLFGQGSEFYGCKINEPLTMYSRKERALDSPHLRRRKK